MSSQKSTREIAGEQVEISFREWKSYTVHVEWKEPDGTSYHIETPIHPNLDRNHPDRKPCGNRNDITLDIVEEAIENVLEERSESGNPTLKRFKVNEKIEIRMGKAV